MPFVACDLSGVRTVDVPRDYQALDGPWLELRYRVFDTAPGAPTVIVVPGGPGSDIMRSSPYDAYALGAVPTSAFNVIYADARGSGCNVFDDVGTEARTFNIDAVARDLLAVVRAEELTNYFVYAASFGTTAATVAAALAPTEGVTAPRQLVLEGTVGHAFASFDAYFATFEEEWTRVKQLIPSAWRTELETEPWSPTLQWSRQQWGTFIAAQLILGDIPGQGHILDFWLTGLSDQNAHAQNYVNSFMAGAAAPGAPSSLFRTIACRELWGSWHSLREVRNGDLRAIGPEVCGDAFDDAAYDAADFPVTVPITYFQGGFDPTTTLEQAEYHRATQVEVRRQFVLVPDASHAPLTLGLYGRNCSASIWAAIAADEDLQPAIDTCDVLGSPIVLSVFQTE